ncbi:MAG: hypothetical protein QJR12_17220 [Mycobacterium sp.]|uniref:hypothetical protein n=1 Tax=Mycobacterium sp. TaxID=1785 RepID=UPI002638B53E|nr:hypothetical protein [Mycobacterium sp.]MDI3315942.1 hypothetical protein [Mycobacterium sp.]
MPEIYLTATSLCIEHLECTDPEVLDFFSDVPDGSRAGLACRVLALGVTGLRVMGVAGQVEVVEREFLKLSQRFDAALGAVESDLLKRVHATFDPDHAESVSARLSASIEQAHGAASNVVAQARVELAKLIGDSFNPDLATSCVYRIAKLVADTQSQLDRAFDPAYEGSHLSKLAKMVESYFGADGTLSALVAAQVAPAKSEFLQALQGVRELIVGRAMAAEERHHSPASGLDFEDEVEEVLCRLANAYGDTVERVGTQAGDTGRSKRGDFIVQLPDGSRFVVEAKKRSTALPLRGDRGVLAMLDESMVNRGATFAVAVAKDHNAFAKEVGAFNDYDANKVLCRFGDGGELLEVAYRWARTALKLGVASDAGVDVSIVANAIDEARHALRELARIEAKAKSIAQGADEIQSLLRLQVRRMNNALDEATAGLVDHEGQAAS